MYRILRNNKEQGPYSLEELLQLSLRPFDLIWVEGRSAGWRYPSEIDTLKNYMAGGIEEPKKDDPVIQLVLNVPTPSPKEITTPLEADEDILTADMLEQKANAIYQRIQAYNAQCEKEAQGVQTKYARSLEDLRQDYADWLHKKKRRKTSLSSGKLAWMAFGSMSTAIIIFIVAGRNREVPYTLDTQPIIVKKTLPVSTNTSAAFASSTLTDETGMALQQHPSAIDLYIDTINSIVNKKERTINTYTVKEIAKKKPAVTAKQIIDSIVIEKQASLEVKPPQPRLLHEIYLDARYTQTENNNRVKEVQVTVHNNGTAPLKQIAVDVYYYKKGEQLFDKETLYFNDIGPGNTYTLTKPGNKKAIEARFQLRKDGLNE